MAKILILDPEPRINDVIKKVLTSRGHAVTTDTSGTNVVVTLSEENPQIIIADAEIAGKVLEQIKVGEHASLVIVTSLLPSKEVALSALREGAFRFLTKPLSVRVLGKAVEAAEAELELVAGK